LIYHFSHQRRLLLAAVLAVYIGLFSFTSHAIAGNNSSRDGFWTRGVQGSPDLEACKQALAQHPDDAVANNDYGWALRMNGQLAEAAKYLRKAISLNSSMSQPYSNLSVVSLELGDNTQAVSNAHKAVALDPSQPIYRVVLGNALAKQHNLDEAIEQYREALRFKNNYENAHYHLGEALLQKGDNAAAQQELSAAISLDSKDERAIALLDKLSAIKTHQ
jgi:tetratricopeptide (TPR) repeat protein